MTNWQTYSQPLAKMAGLCGLGYNPNFNATGANQPFPRKNVGNRPTESRRVAAFVSNRFASPTLSVEVN